MRILLDECVHKGVKRLLPGHDVSTVVQLGWAGKTNGELLASMLAEGIDVLLTVDRNLRYQQNIIAAGVAVIVLIAGGNRIKELAPLAPATLAALTTIKPGDVVEIFPPSP